jgi:hypothetical protein
LQEGPKKSLNGVQAFIPHSQRPSRIEGGLPKTFQRFEGGSRKNLKPLEGSFSRRPSRFEGGPSKNLKPSGRSLLQQTFQV